MKKLTNNDETIGCYGKVLFTCSFMFDMEKAKKSLLKCMMAKVKKISIPILLHLDPYDFALRASAGYVEGIRTACT